MTTTRAIVVVDTNVLLHCKAPQVIDWQAKLAVDEVHLVVPWRVFRELDTHANDGSDAGKKRRAGDRRDLIRDRKKKPIPFRAGVTLEIARAPAVTRENADHEVIDEVARQQANGRAVLATRDGTMAESAELAGLEVLSLGRDDEEDWPPDPTLSKRIHDLTDDVRRIRKELDALAAASMKKPALRLARGDGVEGFTWGIEWTHPRLPSEDEVRNVYGIGQSRGFREGRADESREERGARVNAASKAGSDAIFELRRQAARARRTRVRVVLSIHNDGAGTARNVRATLIADAGTVICRSDPLDPADDETGTIESVGTGGSRLMFATIPVVHRRPDEQLPDTWLEFTPEQAPTVEARFILSADDVDPVEHLLTFNLAPTEDKDTKRWREYLP